MPHDEIANVLERINARDRLKQPIGKRQVLGVCADQRRELAQFVHALRAVALALAARNV